MTIKIAGIIAAVTLIMARIKKVVAWCVDNWAKLSPMIEPIIKEVETAAADGLITREERKKIAMVAIANAEKQGLIELNPITRWIIGKIVDKVAEKLPDIDMAKKSAALVADAIAQTRGGKA